METARPSVDKSDCTIHIASQLIERGWFPGFEKLLRCRLANVFFRAGLDRMDFGRVTEAARYFLNPSACALVGDLCLWEIIRSPLRIQICKKLIIYGYFTAVKLIGRVKK